MTVTIHHNPACATSRKVLALVRAAGVEPTIVEYLKTPPDRATLVELVRRLGVPVRAVLRRRGTPCAALGLDDPSVSDDAVIDAMLAHPVLIERPIVVSERGVRLARPPETVHEIL